LGIDVLVLEKHADFFRDFRGDTIHPSTMELLSELGYSTIFSDCRTPNYRVFSFWSKAKWWTAPIFRICRCAANSPRSCRNGIS
jgi:2-polyprenyl-6-methoxyphenol hydroxylase-like FAD-dependent oxidoreductase